MTARKHVLEVKNVKKYFNVGRSGLLFQDPRRVHAVDGVNFHVYRGDVLALVGESGCGKTTLSLLLMGLEEATDGQIIFEGRDITHLNNKDRKQLTQRIQMVFQDPYESLNPTQNIEEIVSEPLIVHSIGKTAEERRTRVVSALEDAGLKPAADYLYRYPHELSGGQRQRVVIAGALVLEPTLLLADEPVSMLDVSIRAEIINLLAELRRKRELTVVFITHDLGTVGYFADRVAVMYMGRIVEIGNTLDILKNPRHPYTKALLSVIPVPNPRLRHKREILKGETPNPINIPSGCRFHPRCPVAIDACKVSDPPLLEVGRAHDAACLLLVK